MRIIATTLTVLSLLFIALTMKAGLSAGHGQDFFMAHLYWSFGALFLVALTLTLCLLFIFKMHGIIHDLVARLDRLEGGKN